MERAAATLGGITFYVMSRLGVGMGLLVHWLAMNGYAFYVWPAYSLVIIVLTLNLVYILRQRVRARKALFRWFRRS